MNKFRKALEKIYERMHMSKEEYDRVMEIEHQEYLKKIRRKQGEEIIKKGLNQS